MSSYDIFQSFHIPDSSLLAMAEPLLAQAVIRNHEHSPDENLENLSISYTKVFVEKSKVALAILDKDFSFIAMSPKFFKKMNTHFIKPHKITFEPRANFFDIVVPCPDYVKKAIYAALKGKGQRGVGLMTLPSKTAKWIRWEALPWYNFQPEPTGILLFCEDVTKEQNAILMNKRLLKCNELLEDFSMFFFHDLIQPLRQIANFSQLLKEHLEASCQTDDFIETTFNTIDKSMHQIQRLCEGIILYCKEGDLTARAEPVSLFETLEQLRTACLTNNNFHFKILIEEDVKLLMNPICLTQLLQNLIVNAIKHSSEKGTIVTLTGQPAKKIGFYDFEIHNKGLCTHNSQQDIFDPFKSSHTDGAGLGLMICQKVVQAYKGEISFCSSAKKGTRVHFSLPVLHS